jgi:REP element-mobilizing transposase RayT
MPRALRHAVQTLAAAQGELAFRSWGGARPGAGRPCKADAGVSHDARAKLSCHHPVHITLRVRDHVWNLRSQRSLRVFEQAVTAAHKSRSDFAVVHFSLQGNHLHLIVEAADRRSLSRGVQGLTVRLAKGLNRLMGRRGKVFADRYHAHALATPAEVRNALAYVLLNHRSHRARAGERPLHASPDPFSSAGAFDGWASGSAPLSEPHRAPRAMASPATWLLRTGWRRRGLLSWDELPGLRVPR